MKDQDREKVLTDTQAKVLEIVKQLVPFWESKGLKWYVCGGTLLGAVRHKGFIPWDDDFDVYMPRPDYERFRAMGFESGNYRLFSLNDPGYPYPMLKAVDMSTTVIEQRELPYTTGVWVDIFPLDRTTSGYEQIQATYTAFNRLCFNMKRGLLANQWRLAGKALLGGELRRCAHHLLNATYYRWRHEDQIMALRAFVQRQNQPEGDRFILLGGGYGMKEIYNTKWFDEVTYVEFEGLKLPAPTQYDAYLKLLYGDYWELPPVEQRCGHNPWLVNLKQRLDSSQIKRVLG